MQGQRYRCCGLLDSGPSSVTGGADALPSVGRVGDTGGERGALNRAAAAYADGERGDGLSAPEANDLSSAAVRGGWEREGAGDRAGWGQVVSLVRVAGCRDGEGGCGGGGNDDWEESQLAIRVGGIVVPGSSKSSRVAEGCRCERRGDRIFDGEPERTIQSAILIKLRHQSEILNPISPTTGWHKSDYLIQRTPLWGASIRPVDHGD